MPVLREIHRKWNEDFPLFIYRCRKDEAGLCTAPAHYHNDIELLQPLEGCILLSVGDEQLRTEAGKLYFINPEEIHTLYTASAPAAYRCFIIGRNLLNMPGNRVTEQLVDPIFEGRLRFPREMENLALSALLQEINRLEQSGENGAMILGNLWKALALIEPSLIPAEEQKMDDPLRRAIDFMEAHYTERISVPQIAMVAGFNSQYFCSYFKKHTRATPVEYITALRIRHAKELLRRTDLSVLEVAMQSGFENVSFFIQKFKKANGITPLAYRKRK
jgi:AraC-like DNA-binding protein